MGQGGGGVGADESWHEHVPPHQAVGQRAATKCNMLTVDPACLQLSPRAIQLRKWPLSPR